MGFGKAPSESEESRKRREEERRKAEKERNSATEKTAADMSSDVQRSYDNPFSMFNIFKRRS